MISLERFLHRLKMRLIAALMKLSGGASYFAFVGPDSARQLCNHIVNAGVRRLLVVTDKPLLELGVTQAALAGLQATEVATVVFDGVKPDPDFDVVHQGLAVLQQQQCDAVLAVGGGSSIDAAKLIATLATNPVELAKLVGFGKVERDILPLYAIPTTSGTGSEATQGAVISDPDSHDKLVMGDGKMLPLATALDPLLCQGMPPAITAATGMDALTHAIEAYIGTWDRGNCKTVAAAAVGLIFEYLPRACEQGDDLHARQQMALASYYGGMAINQVNVGNVHAIAHQLGGRYGVPHGLGNAMALPLVLRYCLPFAVTRLAELAQQIGVHQPDAAPASNALYFVEAVEGLMRKVGVPTTCAKMRPEDIAQLVRGARAESAGYPVPRLMSNQECEAIFRQLLPASA